MQINLWNRRAREFDLVTLLSNEFQRRHAQAITPEDVLDRSEIGIHFGEWYKCSLVLVCIV